MAGRLMTGALLLLLLCGQAMAGTRIKVATEGAYPPFNFVDDKGALSGFDVEIAQALCRVMDLECEMVKVDWDDLLPGLTAGRYRMIVASMAYSPERAAVAEFTGGYYRSKAALVGRAKQRVSVDAKGLQGRTVATQAGTIHEAYLKKHFSGVVAVKTTPTMEDAFDLLVKGQADLVFVDNLVSLGFLTSPRGKSFDIVGEVADAPDMDTPARIQVPKGEAAFRDQVEAALKTIRMNGTYDRINRKYFPFSIY